MKNKIILIGLISNLLTPFTVFGADNVIKFRKQGTVSVERENAQQTEKLIAPTSGRIIETVEMITGGEVRSPSSIGSSSKLASNADLNKSKRRLRFNPPQE